VAADLPAAVRRADSLQIFRGVLASPPGRAWTAALRAAAQGDWPRAARAHGRLFAALAAEGWAGEAWRAHLAHRTVLDGNVFTLGPAPGPGLQAAAAADLRALEELAAPDVLGRVAAELAARGYAAPPPRDLGPRRPEGLAGELCASGPWAARADALRAHARQGGAGPFAEPLAFRWDAGEARVHAVERPDLPGGDALCGYEAERRQVLENTERLVRGLPANDVLLYGDRGTGKSSTVKSLLPRFGGQGLRLVELGRRDLGDLPKLGERLAGAPQRFIVFVDDLSFEEDDSAYRDAKSALQGGIQARPCNVCVYATSNRRHLVQERLSERDPDDPRGGDAVQEKLSLADRFGLTVVFGAPDQDLYLRIVDHLATTRALALGPAELHAAALRWALWHNGRSGRTARQFVDALSLAAPSGE
jgi:hypothetical protein